MAETKVARLRDDVAMMKNFHDSAKGLAEHKRQMADAAAPYRIVYASGPEGQAIGKAYMESHRSSYRLSSPPPVLNTAPSLSQEQRNAARAQAAAAPAQAAQIANQQRLQLTGGGARI